MAGPALLTQAGLGMLPGELGAKPVNGFLLAMNGSRARLSLPAGMAVSRNAFDAVVRAAVAAGASFLPGTRPTLGTSDSNERGVFLHGGAEANEARTRLVLAADGLGGRLLQGDQPVRPQADSLEAPGWSSRTRPFYTPGTIYMACAAGGYVGLVRVEDGRLDVAAALDPGCVIAAGGPGPTAIRILRAAGLPPVAELEAAAWRGTPALTRRASRLAAERLFVLGDAAGYVEPFTGEGIAWALTAAHAVVPLAVRATKQWEPALAQRWTSAYRDAVGGRQRLCRLLARLLRHPALLRPMVSVLARAPSMAGPVVRRLNRAWHS